MDLQDMYMETQSVQNDSLEQPLDSGFLTEQQLQLVKDAYIDG